MIFSTNRFCTLSSGLRVLCPRRRHHAFVAASHLADIHQSGGRGDLQIRSSQRLGAPVLLLFLLLLPSSFHFVSLCSSCWPRPPLGIKVFLSFATVNPTLFLSGQFTIHSQPRLRRTVKLQGHPLNKSKVEPGALRIRGLWESWPLLTCCHMNWDLFRYWDRCLPCDIPLQPGTFRHRHSDLLRT